MEIGAVLHAFGLASLAHPESLYAHAPVFRVRDTAGDWVVKRTGFVNASGEAPPRTGCSACMPRAWRS